MKTLLIISLLVGSSTLNATTSPMGTIKSLPQESQLNDASEFLARLKDQRLRNFLEGATWTLIHDYSDFKHIEEVLSDVEKFLEALGEHEKGNDIPLSQNGGVKGFKDKLAGWLEDNDQAVRSYAAIMLGVTGDHRYAPQLAALIKSRKAPATHFDRYDRGRAAIALGLVKAKEYAPLLVTLLKSPNKSTRSGAAIGLALLGAKDQAKAIARLQNDQDESVRDSAKEALEILENFKTASQTLTFTEANPNDAVRNKDYSHAVFSFSVGAHRYSVSGSGERPVRGDSVGDRH